ncbi:response regulator [Paenibacillus senegalensis]|uniref:response regulator n=1 Tax=Paenibacillus senegalensis TaxID=1465766 RepID=UPI00028A30B0|nr:response regulator [Paenibacillus senegalensis]
MLKLLIVEDEEMTRNGLKEFVPWQELGIEVAGEATDGVEGLEQAGLVKPDLVLCDVRMPRMNGIEFAGKLREMLPACRLIFISGYSDRAYLKSAIQLNAVDYIEKPIQMDELVQVLQTTVESCREQLAAVAKMERMSETLNQGLPQFTGALLKQFVSASQIMRHEIEARLLSLGVRFPWKDKYGIAALCADSPQVLREAMNMMEKYFAEYGSDYVIGDWSDQVIVIFPDDEGMREGPTALFHRTVKSVNERTGGCAAVALGGQGSGLDELPALLERTVQALQYRFYTGWNHIIHYPYYINRQLAMGIDWKGLVDQWEDYWKKQQFTEAAEWIDKSAGQMREPYVWPVETARKLWFQACLVVWKYYPEALEVYDEKFDWRKKLLHDDLLAITGFLHQVLSDIEISRNRLKSSSGNYAVRKAADFMLSRMSEPLTIQKIADHVYLTPTYLCLLFKKETGCSIHDYLTEARMEQAKKLLQDRTLKLYEIAEQVGYADPKYFTKVFRKMFGCNPSDYREQTFRG